jgi:hypothetical protein
MKTTLLPAATRTAPTTDTTVVHVVRPLRGCKQIPKRLFKLRRLPVYEMSPRGVPSYDTVWPSASKQHTASTFRVLSTLKTDSKRI